MDERTLQKYLTILTGFARLSPGEQDAILAWAENLTQEQQGDPAAPV